MKELDQIVLQEGLFTSIKEHLCLTKGPLDNPEGQVEVVVLEIKIDRQLKPTESRPKKSLKIPY